MSSATERAVQSISLLLSRGSNAPMGWATRLAALGHALKEGGPDCARQIDEFLAEPGNHMPGWNRWEHCKEVYSMLAACRAELSV